MVRGFPHPARKEKKMRCRGEKAFSFTEREILYDNRGAISFFSVPLKNLSFRAETHGKTIFT